MVPNRHRRGQEHDVYAGGDELRPGRQAGADDGTPPSRLPAGRSRADSPPPAELGGARGEAAGVLGDLLYR